MKVLLKSNSCYKPMFFENVKFPVEVEAVEIKKAGSMMNGWFSVTQAELLRVGCDNFFTEPDTIFDFPPCDIKLIKNN